MANKSNQKVAIVQLAAMLLLAMTTGVFWGTWFTLTRSIDEFSAAEFIHIGKVIIANVGDPMKVIMPGTLLLLILCLVFAYRQSKSKFYLMMTSLVLMIIALVITLGVEVPIDNQIKTWTAETVPSNWTELRSTWATYHAARTFISLASLLSFGAAILWRGEDPT
jgi:uncharacterized membrane protein